MFVSADQRHFLEHLRIINHIMIYLLQYYIFILIVYNFQRNIFAFGIFFSQTFFPVKFIRQDVKLHNF